MYQCLQEFCPTARHFQNISAHAWFIWVDILPEKRLSSAKMVTQTDSNRLSLLQGTLDLLILRILRLGREHGQGIARAIQTQSADVLLVEHGALYPALQRLEAKGWISAEWGTSPNNRRARYYTLTKAGRQQLVEESSKWRIMAGAIARVLGPEGQEV